MRKADIDHAWTECRQPDRAQLSIQSVEIEVDGQAVPTPINSRITGFIGPNGAGKTGFLTGLHSAFSGRGLNHPVIRKINGKFRGQTFSIRPEQVETPSEMEVDLIDVSLEVHNIRKHIDSQTNFDELLTQYEPNFPNQGQLDLYYHVCGRRYNRLSLLEIDAPIAPKVTDDLDGEAEEAVFPFFQVQINDVTYDSRTMGFGELCACYLLWRIRRASKGSIILLDEPDSHLSPASRRALIDAMAILAKERQLWIGFTTHSIEMLESLNEAEIFLVASDVVGIPPRIIPIRQRRQAVRGLGLSSPRRLLILVEDVDALAAVWFLINRWGSEIAKIVDVQVVHGGAEELARFVTFFPATRICGAIAVLDGDKRDSIAGLATERIFYLPGIEDPIEAARSYVKNECTYFAALLGVNSEELRQAIKRVDHVNHHDFLAKLLEEQNIEGKGVQDVRVALLNSWLSSESISPSARTLVAALIQVVDMLD